MKLFVNEAADVSCGETYRAQYIRFLFKQDEVGLMFPNEGNCKFDFEHIAVQFTYLNEIKELIDKLNEMYKEWENKHIKKEEIESEE